MTEKMYDKLLEKHRVFQILKRGKAFSHIDFNSTIKINMAKRFASLAILILIRQFGKKTLGCAIIWK